MYSVSYTVTEMKHGSNARSAVLSLKGQPEAFSTEKPSVFVRRSREDETRCRFDERVFPLCRRQREGSRDGVTGDHGEDRGELRGGTGANPAGRR